MFLVNSKKRYNNQFFGKSMNSEEMDFLITESVEMANICFQNIIQVLGNLRCAVTDGVLLFFKSINNLSYLRHSSNIDLTNLG